MMRQNNKIHSLERLAEVLEPLRARKRIVHCHGVFDLLHIGHIRYFEQAKKMGDILVVTITPDRYVNKGPHRPVFSEHLRAEAVASSRIEGVFQKSLRRAARSGIRPCEVTRMP